ncbi:hypothetical protein GGR55DRAFT_699667 [Xylaria sp. FL0064]|nr:hypothetical protein GGR55DRAFT_699667 [Xylaria sp. FL0064]
MEDPITPQKKILPTALGQVPTPPPSAPVSQEAATDTNNSLDYNSPLPIREKQPLHTDGGPEGDVKTWIYASDTREKQRERFLSVLHACYPSNDTFNSARHPFYDPEEAGDYEDFIKCQEWDGECPLDDDDYNPLTDPTWSTEVWEPKIGDEGIENEQDLHMVLRARREHKARSEALKSQLAQGMSFLSVAQEMQLDDSESSSESEKEEKSKDKEAEVCTKAPSDPSHSTVQPATSAKRVVVFGEEEPSKRRRGQPGKNKKKRRGRKRKRGSKANPNDSYRYNSDSEDEKPAIKRAKGKGKGKEKAAADDTPWKAQTRAAARRTGNMGMDGCYDIDSDNSTASEMIITAPENDGHEPKKGLFSRFTSFIAG